MNTTNTAHQLIAIAVVGHTNTGKTSLLRTLLRDAFFGEVKNASATTRHVSQVQIFGENAVPLAVMHDTPGLEDATGVMDFIHAHTDARLDGVERLQDFLAAADAQDARLDGDYSQEAKVIRNLLQVDVALYVIDAREPILSKYKDELAILASSGKPILPVFNFIKDQDDNMNAWREMLSRRALHVTCAFDTVAFDFNAEMALWHNMQTLCHQHQNLQTLIEERTRIWLDLAEMGSLLIADFLVNAASFSQKIAEDTDSAPILANMQNTVRQAEEILHKKLLEHYRFYHSHVNTQAIDITGKHQDIFDAELLTRYGIRTAGGSVTGMIIGAGIDVATLGATFGLGTAIGGVIGGLLPNTNTLKDKALGVQTLAIDDATLTLLATRAQSLHFTLRHRGHASLDAITAADVSLPWQTDKLPSALKKARANPHYCSLTEDYQDKQGLRSELADKLSKILEEHLQTLG